MRDYLHKTGQQKQGLFQDFAGRYRRLFPCLREEIDDFGQFNTLNDWNYVESGHGGVTKLGNNLVNSEIDIVLETPQYLCIGEAKAEMSFNADGKRVLVHQLVRQYVMARILVDYLESEKEVVHFVVGEDVQSLMRRRQVRFMLKQGWIKRKNILTWNEIATLACDS